MKSVSKSSVLLRSRRAGLYFYALLVSVLSPTFVSLVLAQPRTFAAATTQITDKVAVGGFGAMVVAITGILAIVSAVTGSYKGAWAVLYVSVGLYILKELVQLLFNVA